MKQHKISWLNIPGYIPETWNPIIGCSKVSPGCQNCYAEKMASRICAMEYAEMMKGIPMSKAKTQYNRVMKDHGKHWCGYTYLVESQLGKPIKWKKPRVIFVCSMSDLFHESTDFKTKMKVYDVMMCNPQHIYILLTKRPDKALEFFQTLGFHIKQVGLDSVPSESNKPLDYIDIPENVWIGVTAENQEQADKRIPILLQIPAKVRFVSCEPLLSEIRLLSYIPVIVGHTQYSRDSQLDWVIVGPETGPGARSCQIEWMENIGQQCRDAGIPFYDKRNLLGLRITEFPNFMGQ